MLARSINIRRLIALFALVMAALGVAIAIALLTRPAHAATEPASVTDVTPVSVLDQVKAGSGPFVPGQAAADPGVTLYTYMHEHGATMPASWAGIVDDNHALICRNYAAGFAGWPAGDRDDYGVTVPLGEAAISATGFCS